MSDHHHHDHQISSLEGITKAFYVGIGLNLIFTFVEFYYGFQSQSLALLSDASHNLSDVASLVISLIGMRLAQKAATQAYTYGYKKASIFASLINAILLISVVIGIFKTAIERLSSPPEVPGNIIIITACIGVVINGVSALLFAKGQKHDINIKGAFLHLMVDALVSVGVVLSGIIIQKTAWYIIDPIISFVIVAVILISSYGLLKESIKLSLDGIPQGIDLEKIKTLLLANDQVCNVHHIHIWALSSTQNALTAHIIPCHEISLKEAQELKHHLKHLLKHQHIDHATLEIGSTELNCCDIEC